jgi:acyl-CoA hydrolase
MSDGASSSVVPVASGTPTASRVEAVHIVLPGLTNALGSIFGGILMQWIDIAGAIAGARHALGPVVTASVDRIHFLRPVKLGDVVIVQAQVNHAARTSMEVGVRVFSEDQRTREQHQATRAYLTFVAIDESGKPRPIRPLVLETADDQRRFAKAARRRSDRLAERNEMGIKT